MNWTHIAEVAIGVAGGFVGFVAIYFAALPLLIKLFVPWLRFTNAVDSTEVGVEPDADRA